MLNNLDSQQRTGSGINHSAARHDEIRDVSSLGDRRASPPEGWRRSTLEVLTIGCVGGALEQP
jgi:hypothetical protein